MPALTDYETQACWASCSKMDYQVSDVHANCLLSRVPYTKITCLSKFLRREFEKSLFTVAFKLNIQQIAWDAIKAMPGSECATLWT